MLGIGKKVLGTNLKKGWVPVFATWIQRKYLVLTLGGGATTYFLGKVGLVPYGVVSDRVDPPWFKWRH